MRSFQFGFSFRLQRRVDRISNLIRLINRGRLGLLFVGISLFQISQFQLVYVFQDVVELLLQPRVRM